MYSPRLHEMGKEPYNFSKNNSAINNLAGPAQWINSRPQNHEQLRAASSEAIHSFFEFEPPTQSNSQFPPQFPSPLNLNIISGWNELNNQVPSPPDSAVSPRSTWPTPHHPQSTHNILTDIHPEIRMQYGQATPPDDEATCLFDPPEQPPPQQEASQDRAPSGGRKRKRSSAFTETKAQSKRGRKTGPYSKLEGSSSGASGRHGGLEESRRSKFLERNRVAASKCRQKKKEWTQNLENRARQLQKENGSLRLMLESLRDEMLFIKGEMLKHTGCGCEQIQAFLNSSINSIDNSPFIKHEQSPINSAPGSRRGSVSTAGFADNQDPSMASQNMSEHSDRKDIETLLMNELVNDTNDHVTNDSLQSSS